ncbi:PqqD family protein [Emcibacter sp. SYSU 3D8]|uniref:PqqD family protein n=1 Tax=Emcibacter sp. SYSU 3D8 TaxID=3133969 RepID=UPI0031FEFCE1
MGNTTRFKLNEPDVTAKVMDGEAVIIHLGTGVYYSMDGVGCLVWDGIASGHEIGAVIDAVAAQYALDRNTAEADIARLVGELVAAELIVPADGPSPSGSALPGEAPATYQSPALMRYDDMAELLALDPPLPAAPR